METADKVQRPLGSIVLFFLGFALVFGALVFFGYGVAGTLFREIGSKDLAGAVNRAILTKLNHVTLVGISMMLYGVVSVARQSRGRTGWILVALNAVIAGIFSWYAFGIGSEMNALAQTIHSFNFPDPQQAVLHERFTALHSLYSSLVGINMGFTLISFLWFSLIVAEVSVLATVKKFISR